MLRWSESENWLNFRIFARDKHTRNSRDRLVWYYRILNYIVKPLLRENEKSIRAIFFSHYGPKAFRLEKGYEKECERVAKQLVGRTVFYIWLRLCVEKDDKDNLRRELIDKVKTHQDDLILDYEICRYDVVKDLGCRFCKTSEDMVDEQRLINFIKFWDSTCRYTLSIITSENKLDENVDVMGVPHLVFNSLGTFIPLTYKPDPKKDHRCPDCNEILYANTLDVCFQAFCLRCDRPILMRGNL